MCKSNDEPELSGLRKRAAKIHRAALARGIKSPATEEVIAERLQHLRRELGFGVLIAIAALAIHFGIEHSIAGRRMQLWAYEHLISAVNPSSQGLSVAIVDIGRSFDKEGTEITDLAKLRKLMENLAAAKPTAIAIDIDMGFDDVRQQFTDDKGLVVPYAHQLTESGKVPVFLTVDRGLENDPSEWLGDAKYIPIVVNPFRPRDALSGQMLMFEEISIAGTRVPGLAQKLAESHFLKHGSPRKLPNWIASEYTEHGEDRTSQVHTKSFYLNIPALDAIENNSVRASDPNDVRADQLRGKVVIVGSSEVPSDRWVAPITGEVHSGLALHALATHTLISAPVYELNAWIRTLLALVTGLLIVGAVQAIKRRYIAEANEVASHRIAGAASLVAAGLAILIGYWLARIFSILWTDYFLVAALTLQHPAIERRLTGGFISIRRAIGGMWRKFALEDETK